MHVCGAQWPRTKGYTYNNVMPHTTYNSWMNRWDTSVSEATYNTAPPSGTLRTLSSLTTNCVFSKPEKHLGSKHPPLLHLEPSQYVLDELHLLLRVSDVLVRNIIHLADHLDQESGLRRGRRGTHIPDLQNLIQSCGVPFKISQVQHNIMCNCE